VLVIFTIAGTMLVLEGLGDIEGFSDEFMGSGMGAISFFQMIYFSFMTISTVGYGDFTPTTVLSRFFACVSIFVGVTVITHINTLP
jgi:voltage-gated potassium channel